MMKKKSDYTLKISSETREPVLDIAMDTINLNKQAIIFVNTKRSAESVAEKLAKHIKIDKKEQEYFSALSTKILKTLSTPTRQCKRLALCIEKGVAFHHSGLHSQQRKLIEQNFKNRKIKVIAATPTLAQGVDLPAYRTIIRDLKRFSSRGMRDIPVLEYEQQSGRAGRPGQENLGQAICIAKSEKQKKDIIKKYINGTPEDIISKLAVEPVLRSYVLSLVASQYCSSFNELEEFFSKTFFAFQYGNKREMKMLLLNIIDKLDSWKFIQVNKKADKNNNESNSNGFVSAKEYSDNKNKKDNIQLRPTVLGKRVSELYLDPYTAHYIIEYVNQEFWSPISLLFMFTNCIEMKPLISVPSAKVEETESWLSDFKDKLGEESELLSIDYYELLRSVRTTMFVHNWINEFTEEQILEKYNVRPGELNAKIEILNWIIYSASQLTRLTNNKAVKHLVRLRIRVRNGCKEELIPLLRFKNIGRVRARKLYFNNVKNAGNIKTINYERLSSLLGKNIAKDLKKQVNVHVADVQEKLI